MEKSNAHFSLAGPQAISQHKIMREYCIVYQLRESSSTVLFLLVIISRHFFNRKSKQYWCVVGGFQKAGKLFQSLLRS